MVSPPHRGLLTRLSGVLAIHGITIMSAQLQPLEDGRIARTFHVADQFGGAIPARRLGTRPPRRRPGARGAAGSRASSGCEGRPLCPARRLRAPRAHPCGRGERRVGGPDRHRGPRRGPHRPALHHRPHSGRPPPRRPPGEGLHVEGPGGGRLLCGRRPRGQARWSPTTFGRWSSPSASLWIGAA